MKIDKVRKIAKQYRILFYFQLSVVAIFFIILKIYPTLFKINEWFSILAFIGAFFVLKHVYFGFRYKVVKVGEIASPIYQGKPATILSIIFLLLGIIFIVFGIKFLV